MKAEELVLGAKAPLFALETNRDFALEPEPVSAALEEVAQAFGLRAPRSAAKVRKASPTSAIHRVETAEGPFMLRRVEAAARELTERQCNVVDRLAHPRFLRPRRAEDGRFTRLAEGGAWMAYPALEGEVFSGRHRSAVAVLRDALGLLGALRELGETSPPSLLAGLPAAKHEPEAWAPFFTRFGEPGFLAAHPEVAAALSPGAKQLLQDNVATLPSLARDLAQLDLGPRVLVHNDLQHANVLVGPRGIAFIDLEDIVLEHPGVAAAHAAFKLLRHPVYEGFATPETTRDVTVPAALDLLARSRLGLRDRDALFSLGAYRIVSEVYDIVDRVTERGEIEHLYDLEKRFVNLFELARFCR